MKIVSGKSATHMQNLCARCGNWLRLSRMLQGFFCLLHHTVCLNYVTFPKFYVIWEFSEEILIFRICLLKSCTVLMNLDFLLTAEFIYWGFCCCFLDNHSRFPQSSCFCVPWLRCTCCLWLILFVWTVLIFVGVILINFLFSQTILIPVFYKGW